MHYVLSPFLKNEQKILSNVFDLIVLMLKDLIYQNFTIDQLINKYNNKNL